MILTTLAGIAAMKSAAMNIAAPELPKRSTVSYVRPRISPLLALHTSVNGGDTTICSLDVADWELAKVVRVLSQQTNVNVIALSNPDKKLTIRLSDISLAEMIKHICAVSGMAYVKSNGTYVVATAEQLKAAYPVEWASANPVHADPMSETAHEIYLCSFVNASQIAETLSKLFKDQNLQVVTGPMQQVPSLANAETSSTGATASMIKTDSATSGGGSGASLAGKTILVRGPKPIVDAAMALAKELDRPQPQVSIAVRVHDISNDALKDLGLSWSFSNVGISENKGTGFNFGRFDRSPFGFNAAISALEQKNVAKLLAEPNIAVLDGEKAMILIGSRLNFPQLIGYTNANTPIFDRQEERVGIYMQVSASITPDGYVTLSLYPQVSTVSGYLNVNGASYPQISTREAQTTLRVKSGETIIMGGLMRDEELTQIDKVPLLSEIPLLGELFKHRKTTRAASQVIISITPIVLSQPGNK